jgi:hypothetical protein
VPFEQLLDRAVLNLRAISPASFKREPSGFHISTFNDHYDCSRLLVPELFDLLSLNGDPVAIAVARNALVVAGSRDTGALLAMASFVEDALKEATRPISFLPLVLKNGHWTFFDPVEAELAPIRELRAKQFLWDYDSQCDALDEHFQRIGRDVYVAQIDARRYDEGIFGITTWGQNVETLLPRADAVALFRGQGEPIVVRSWEHFWTVFGEVLVNEGFYPERYLTPKTIDLKKLSRLEREFPNPPWFTPKEPDAS